MQSNNQLPLKQCNICGISKRPWAPQSHRDFIDFPKTGARCKACVKLCKEAGGVNEYLLSIGKTPLPSRAKPKAKKLRSPDPIEDTEVSDEGDSEPEQVIMKLRTQKRKPTLRLQQGNGGSSADLLRQDCDAMEKHIRESRQELQESEQAFRAMLDNLEQLTVQ